ncbi:VanZ family protein [bacterium]|nr:MAG: VanZ family protein [bacterium]
MPSTTSGAERSRKFLLIWGPPVGMAVIIFIGSAIPGKEIPQYPEIFNNIIHFVEFATLGFFLTRAFENFDIFSRMFDTIAWTTVICLGYGLMVELYQFTVPNRVFDTADLAMDASGALIGSLIYGWAYVRGKQDHNENI